MGVLNWPSVALTGSSQVIPAVCPNCLGPAEVKYRYNYVSPFYFISRTTYYQSFAYCRRCEPMMDTYFKWRSKGCLVYGLYVVLIIGGIATAAGLSGPGGALHSLGAPGAIAIGLLPAVLLWLLLRSLRAKAMAKHPLQQGQLGHRPAAYYTGQTLGGLGNKHVYRALRPEWLAALVRANPFSVDAVTYKQVTGEAQPQKDDRKPFA